ncbi:formylglycine-generating enzyme family protein [Oscillatoria sp. CS-180]|uniref:formylglycine-generating enzyme family protein n=1 Tax=Oscillatoria sp. CS-180 TaxID=3021720 RepID=UPI00232D9B53|nr:formylglycine-generating enzyme family protein [Oscillatoria sp. CS-180]MDB9529065.1 formylglycine-generating enzyme family protein [Oscillatoria sp. CS-180]
MMAKTTDQRLQNFIDQFGQPHLDLAYHAAFPMALTPDLIYRLWAHFRSDVQGRPLNIPWVAVADVMLAPFCNEVGLDLYEMDADIRADLLLQLQMDSRFGAVRQRELANFLLTYYQSSQLYSDDPDVKELAQIQRWMAMAQTQPTQVVKELARNAVSVQGHDEAEWGRMAGIMAGLPLPDEEAQTLLHYVRGMATLMQGQQSSALEEFRQLPGVGRRPVTVAGVPLTIPEELRQQLQPGSPVSRRRWLQLTGWGVAGVIGVGLVNRALQQDTSPIEEPNSQQIERTEFRLFDTEIAFVDEAGEIVLRHSRNIFGPLYRRDVQDFVLELVDIPASADLADVLLINNIISSVAPTIINNLLDSIFIDGRLLFRVASPNNEETPQLRTRTTNEALDAWIKTDEDLLVATEIRNRTPVILINDQYLMSVTARDADLWNQAPLEEEEGANRVNEYQLAVIWAEVLTRELALAQRMRRRNASAVGAIQAVEGAFLMGSPEGERDRLESEGPQRWVTVSAFTMGRYPVTQAQWRYVAENLERVNRNLEPDPSQFKGDDRPVETVSWEDATEFCDRLSAFLGVTCRLPTEAEWEYACRAGTTTPFHFGETITSDLVSYDASDSYGSGPTGEYRQETTPVGSFGVANAFGLYDMHGNVWEWCQDVWHGNYEGAPTDGSAWVEGGDQGTRVVRGGSWYNNPRYCRSASRVDATPATRDFVVGFRVVCVAAA